MKTFSSSEPVPCDDEFAIPDDRLRLRLEERAAPWREKDVAAPDTLSDGKLARRGMLPGRRRAIVNRSACKVVRTIVAEMVALTGTDAQHGRDRRFVLCHMQQIAMYVSHVVLQLTMADIAAAFGKDRTTVGHACARVEDRRDLKAYDQLVGAVERVVNGVFAPSTRH